MNYNESHSDLARLLWRACLNNTPWCQSAFKWMRDVRVGDLVVELTSRAGRSTRPSNCQSAPRTSSTHPARAPRS